MENFDFKSRFAENVFTDEEMKKRMPAEAYEKYEEVVAKNKTLPLDLANEIAKAMKDWAIEKGATHYTHWFQPMTGVTAEKHDSFLEPEGEKAILKFTGKILVRGESDASSLPNGGLRSTFEARGYTAWDPTSKAFVRDGSLYIPTVFCSYGGESLDKKTPLLRSVEAINKQALRILRAMGDKKTKKVFPTVGVEQEYFLVDKSVYEKRLDLANCGRTLFGAKPPKGQEIEDHYLGKIKARVWDYMADLDREMWKLGVYAKTKHNEVAPAQHELASVYTTTNLAVDNNQLTMSVMKSVANRHGMVCLLHEKPFEGVNGSGKHNNWSLATDQGENLFEPSENPSQNKKFLLFFTAVVSAVDKYQDLLRISASSAGNDHRLGGHEAPPAIISMFIGDDLLEIFTAIESGTKYIEKDADEVAFCEGILPHLKKDKTDRNRTSPFAFTGNKFEFRMVGADMSVASANTVLNTIVAEQFRIIADKLESQSDVNETIDYLIVKAIRKHGRIIFNGNNYSNEWKKEAERRGLLNLPTTVDALERYIIDKNIELFERHEVLTAAEVTSRYEIMLESYGKTVEVEARTMSHIVKRQIIPAVIKFEKEVAETLNAKKTLGLPLANSAESALIVNLSNGLDKLYTAVSKLEYDLNLGLDKKESYEKARFEKDVIIPDMQAIREVADGLERITDKSLWPFPTYTEILNSVTY
ncbi:MAG: glutamine synthetase type III [Clostridiales bacterium]|nr:glutamine synthetase type III [Clostridiales bacterium]